MRETVRQRKERAGKIVAILRSEYPDARCLLDFTNPLELLVATILSAQCADEQVNKVTAELFVRFKGAADYALAPAEELEQAIRSIGLYRNKAKSLRRCCAQLTERHDGRVPTSLDELVALDGVGRKTANVVLGNAFGQPGIAVDTHVRRVAGRLKLTASEDPVKIEFDLMKLVPKDDWTVFSHVVSFHGRRTCNARRPACESCCVEMWCPGSMAVAKRPRQGLTEEDRDNLPGTGSGWERIGS